MQVVNIEHHFIDTSSTYASSLLIEIVITRGKNLGAKAA